MPMILQTKIYSSLVYHNSFFLLFSGSTLFESVELAVFFQKEVMIYTAKGAKETCRPPADCIILSIGSVKVTYQGWHRLEGRKKCNNSMFLVYKL
jgi:hypothetical protein